MECKIYFLLKRPTLLKNMWPQNQERDGTIYIAVIKKTQPLLWEEFLIGKMFDVKYKGSEVVLTFVMEAQNIWGE